MTLTDELKILDDKIKANQAHHDLSREAAKTSALSSKDLLEKQEYLTSEYLGKRPSALKKTKFEYSPLSKFFTKELDKDDQKEGLFKRLKNIEDEQKNLTRGDDNESIYYTPRSQMDSEHDKDEDRKTQEKNIIDTKQLNVFDYLKSLSQEAEDLMEEIKDAVKDIDIYKLVFIGSNKEKFDFNHFEMPLNSLLKIYNGQITLKRQKFIKEIQRKKQMS